LQDPQSILEEEGKKGGRDYSKEEIYNSTAQAITLKNSINFLEIGCAQQKAQA